VRLALEVLGCIVAALAVGATVGSAIETVVLPRAAPTRIPRVVSLAVRKLLTLGTKRSTSYTERDRLMALLGPVALVCILGTWLLIILTAYAVVFFCVTGRSWSGSIELSGSSAFTLGTSSDSRLGPSLLSYSEAGLGLLIVALFITYFPSIYGAFTRREAGVALLQVRAGSPPTAVEMLIRYHRIEGRRYQLTDLWRQWEAWFADIDESHTTFKILPFFRSPQPERSWVVAAGTLLDAASFWLACVSEHPIDPDAQLCIRAGYIALRHIADAYRIPYDPDPTPDGPITISRQEWDQAMGQMEAAGVPLIDDRDQAWRDWRGWRVNYDTALLRLARLVEAPLAPWVSDRTPLEIWDRRFRTPALSSVSARVGPGRRANGSQR
jgi:hypothetical protein